MKQRLGNRKQETGNSLECECGLRDICFPFVLAFVILLLAAGSALCGTFADNVESYNPGPGQFFNNPLYNNPARCLGAPHGLYVDEVNNSSVATLGDGGNITLSFTDPIQDDPKNPYGMDFIVFSNASFIDGPDHRWQELAFVEISQNGSVWYLILPSKLPSELVPPLLLPLGGYVPGDIGPSYTVVSGYAEYTPTIGLPQELDPQFRPFPVSRTAEELDTVPERPSVPDDPATIEFDYVSGGGDAFDIAKAVVRTSPGVPALDGQGNTIPANITWFRYIRITDARTGDSIPGLGEMSAEIDAVSDIAPAMSIGEAKKLPANGYAVITDAIVTAVFPTGFFIESPDRSAAIKVTTTQLPSVGDKLTITGHISKTGGVFAINDPMFTVTSSGNDIPKPLGMPLKSLESDLAYGLRVRTWGKVTSTGDGSYIIIADGSKSAKVTYTGSITVATGNFVTVSGIHDKEEGSLSTIIKTTDPTEIQKYAQ